MRFSRALAAVASLPLATAHASLWHPSDTAGTDKLAQQALQNVVYQQAHPLSTATCKPSNTYARKEWLTLSPREKRAYISAVKCLQSKPSISGALAPGAKSRFDDFVATQTNQTLTIHATGNFLSWHRYYTWAYEQALRTECGYKGYQPYINWAKYAHDIIGSPLFDGSDLSMSGNGAYIPHAGVVIATNLVLKPGNGSGCVTNGPFKDFQANLGPVAPAFPNLTTNPQPDGLGFNPRCLRRDLTQDAANRGSNESIIYDLITKSPDIRTFQTTMQGDFPNNYLGVHTAGHYWVSGDPGGHFFASPGDPFFYLHHAMIDRTWWIWQNLDAKHRTEVVADTITLFNTPPSRNATLDDLMDLGVNAPAIKLRDAMSTIAGSFCYVYV